MNIPQLKCYNDIKWQLFGEVNKIAKRGKATLLYRKYMSRDEINSVVNEFYKSGWSSITSEQVGDENDGGVIFHFVQ